MSLDPDPARLPTTVNAPLAGAVRPATIVGAFYLALLIGLLATHAWDARFFATVGPQWQRHDPEFQKRSDGFIYLSYAIDIDRASQAHSRLRTARILYPLAARGLALGHVELLPWALVLVNLAAIVAGTEILHRLLVRRGLSPWAALAYGGWVGQGLALLRDTPEPLTYFCAVAGVAALESDRRVLGGAALLAALLARETALAFVLPYLFLGRTGWGPRRWLLPLSVLGLWGVWLAVVYAFFRGPWVSPQLLLRPPLRAYLSTRLFDLPATVLFLIVPALIVLVWALRELWRRRDVSVTAAALNAFLVLWLPSRTAQLLWHSARLSTGLIPAVLLASALAAAAPRLWRGLALLFTASAGWTLAVALRYMFWDVL